MNLTTCLRLEVQSASNDAFVWGVSTWTGYRFGGPADSAESGVEWADMFNTSTDIRISRGAKRDGLTLSLEAGTLEANIRDSRVDPNTNPYIKPGTPIRLMYNDGSTDTPVFTGVIRQVQVTYKDRKPQVRISAVDRVKDLANTSRSGVISGTYAQRVAELLSKHGIPNTVTGSSGLVLAQNAYDSSLLNHLNLATVSEQGRVFVAKDNTVKAYGKNATYSAVPSWWFTDKKVVQRTNLAPDGSFEGAGAFGNGLSAHSTAALDTTKHYQGLKSVKVTTTTNTQANAAIILPYSGSPGVIPVTEGLPYTVSAWVYTDTANRRARVRIGFWNTGGSQVTSGFGSYVTLTPGEWTQISHTSTPAIGSGSAYIHPYAYVETVSGTTNTGEDTWVDAFLVEQTTTVGTYIEGDSATKCEYVDIGVAYDSASLVNDIYVNNLTYGLNEEMEPISISTKYGPYRNVTSIATYGAFTEEVETNLGSLLDIEDFAADVLAANKAPELRVDSVRINVTEKPGTGADLEVFDTVNVEYDTDDFHIGEDMQVLNLTHVITASNDRHKWMVDVGLITKEGI